MKLPLWYKDRNGKWHNFPYDMLTTDRYGRLGIAGWTAMNHPDWDLFRDGILIRQYFDYHPQTDRWLLKEKYR